MNFECDRWVLGEKEKEKKLIAREVEGLNKAGEQEKINQAATGLYQTSNSKTELASSTYFYHWDHLGTARLITDNSGNIVSRHDFEPFGVEIAPYNDTAQNTHKFTGHERDISTEYDYMHARYYGSSMGRFMSSDLLMGSARPEEPQSWNRYSYVENNAVVLVDPTGEIICFSRDFAKEELNSIIQSLNEFTGNEYIVNEKNELVLIKEGENASKTATDFLNRLISSDQYYNVVKTEGNTQCDDKNTVQFNPKMFEGAIYSKGFNPVAFGLGSALIHELFHLDTGLPDRAPSGELILNTGWTGKVVDFVNQIRKERSFPLRESYIAEPGIRSDTYRARFDHVNPSKPNKIYYVIMKKYLNK